MEITVKIPVGLVTELATERNKVTAYETHRGFKALAFYLLSRSLTTSAGIYRELASGRGVAYKGSADGYETWSRFHKAIAKQIGLSFNSVRNYAVLAEQYGFIEKTNLGYKFVALDKIEQRYALFQAKYHTITIKKEDSLEHVLKTLVFKENFARQEYSVTQKIKRIPELKEKLQKFIPNWQDLPANVLLKQIVQWQRFTFLNFSKGTEAYDLFHAIHADIALTCKKIAEHFRYKSRQSSMYIKDTLAKLQYMAVEQRQLIGYTTRKPKEFDGTVKPITFVWMPGQQQRKWIMPDLITLKLENLTK